MIEELKKENTSQRGTYIFLIIGILALLGVVLLVRNGVWQRNKVASPQNLPEDIVVPKIVQASREEVVGGFPEELILNAKTEIIRSYSATYPNSSAQQATVEFTSSKNTDENLNFYTKWANDNGWSIVNSSKGDTVSSLYFKKASEQINITINKGVIKISYVNLNK